MDYNKYVEDQAHQNMLTGASTNDPLVAAKMGQIYGEAGAWVANPPTRTKTNDSFGGLIVGLVMLPILFLVIVVWPNMNKQTELDILDNLPQATKDKMVADFAENDKHLAIAGGVVDEHLCYRKLGTEYEACETIEELGKLAQRFGPEGIAAHEKLQRQLKTHWLPNLDGEGGILKISNDGTVSTMFKQDTFWGLSIKRIVIRTNEFIAKLKKMNPNKYNAESKKLPRVTAMLKILPGTGRNPICWDVTFDGPEWKKRGCKRLP